MKPLAANAALDKKTSPVAAAITVAFANLILNMEITLKLKRSPLFFAHLQLQHVLRLLLVCIKPSSLILVLSRADDAHQTDALKNIAVVRRITGYAQMVGTMTVVNGDTFAVEQVITTQPTARTLALDSVRHILYAVAAEIETRVAEGVRPELKPGSFQLLTISS